MYKHLITTLLLFAIGVCFTNTKAHAVEDLYKIGEPITVEAGVWGGYSIEGDIDDKEQAMGLRILFNLNPFLALETSASRLQDQREFLFSDTGFDFSSETEIDIFTFDIGMKAQVPIGDLVTIYGLGGIGVAVFDTDDTTTSPISPISEGTAVFTTQHADTTTELSCRLGLGAEVLLNKNIKAFAEYRHVFTHLDLEIDSTITTRTTRAGLQQQVLVEKVTINSYSGSSRIDDSYGIGLILFGLLFYY